mgnify:CR=1 FL=1|tara:strand:+ start:164 stop:400 length:237 start_codon:yes stop_codon:yes gene_type:complete
MKCYFCDVNERKTWSGYFCTTCEEIQSLAKVYGFERLLDIIQIVCLRDEEQLENKIKNLNKNKSKIVTRSKSEDVTST